MEIGRLIMAKYRLESKPEKTKGHNKFGDTIGALRRGSSALEASAASITADLFPLPLEPGYARGLAAGQYPPDSKRGSLDFTTAHTCIYLY
jgi:hypothetical protein